MINKRYKIIKQIGEGRSRVFLCEDKFFPEDKLAIKILQYTANDSEIAAFNKEFWLIKKFNHPNIITAYDTGIVLKVDEEYKAKYRLNENDRFMTLEWIDGKTINECEELQNEKIVLQIIKQIALALQYIHQSNHIYFDIKPDNILIEKIDNRLNVKLIDFGLTKYVPELEKNYLKGSSEYISPELLKNNKVDFRTDFYSLGIVLYHLAYQKFPFRNENILEIYRAHIEKEFEFPSSKYSPKIVKIIKRLLAKNPDKRYATSFDLIYDLGLEVERNERINLVPAISFEEREEVSNQLKDFMGNDSWGKIVIVNGESGSGKSALLEEMKDKFSNIILIKTNNFISSYNFWQQFFSRLLFYPHIYKSVDDSLIQYVSLHIEDNSTDLLIELKTIISKIASSCNFVLAIDDFDKLEAHNAELFLQLFPILLANQIKIVLSSTDSSSIELPANLEKEIITLAPFSIPQIRELIDKSFYERIDKEELSNVIVSFSEKQPASIFQFISNLIVTDILKFKSDGIVIEYEESKIADLISTQKDIFEFIFNGLDDNEKRVLGIISIFSIEISLKLISAVSEIPFGKIQLITNSLRIKNILQSINQTRNANFSNIGFKRFVYSKIADVEKLHEKAGEILLSSFPDMNILNKIRQFELAKEFNKVVEIIDRYLSSETTSNFPQLKRTLLQKKRKLLVNDEKLVSVILDLVDIEIELANYSNAIKLLSELKKYNLSKQQKIKNKKFLGIVSINTGDIHEGIKILLGIVEEVDFQTEIFLEIAGGYIELNNYKKAELICEEILKTEKENLEFIGRAKNLLGISNLYSHSDLNVTLKFFQDAHSTYTSANNFMRIAGSEVNLGNIQNILGNYSKAEKHWNKALQLNQSIGNVEQEANILMNTGVFNYEIAKYEKALMLYMKAGNIFRGLGNRFNYGLVNTNLGEVYLELCEFKKALSTLEIAEKVFRDLQNKDELIEVIFIKARVFIALHDFQSVTHCFEKISKIKSDKSERELILTNFMIVSFNLSKNDELDEKRIEELINKLFEINEKILASEMMFRVAEKLIYISNFDKALELLNSKKMIDIINRNSKLKATRIFLLSKIPTKFQSDLSFTRNFLLQKAFALIKNGSITALTLQVLNDIVIFYSERGNKKKAEHFSMYGILTIKTIYDHNISESIGEARLNILYKSMIDNFQNHIEQKLMLQYFQSSS